MTELDPILGAALAAICACLCVALAGYWLSGDWRQTFTAAGDDVEGRRRFELGALASTDLRFVKNDEERFARGDGERLFQRPLTAASRRR